MTPHRDLGLIFLVLAAILRNLTILAGPIQENSKHRKKIAIFFCLAANFQFETSEKREKARSLNLGEYKKRCFLLFFVIERFWLDTKISIFVILHEKLRNAMASFVRKLQRATPWETNKTTCFVVFSRSMYLIGTRQTWPLHLEERKH